MYVTGLCRAQNKTVVILNKLFKPKYCLDDLAAVCSGYPLVSSKLASKSTPSPYPYPSVKTRIGTALTLT